MKRAKIHKMKVYCPKCNKKVVGLVSHKEGETMCPNCGSELMVKAKHLHKMRPDLYIRGLINALEKQNFMCKEEINSISEHAVFINPYISGVKVEIRYLYTTGLLTAKVSYTFIDEANCKSFRVLTSESSVEGLGILRSCEDSILDFIWENVCEVYSDNPLNWYFNQVIQSLVYRGVYVSKIVPMGGFNSKEIFIEVGKDKLLFKLRVYDNGRVKLSKSVSDEYTILLEDNKTYQEVADKIYGECTTSAAVKNADLEGKVLL